MAAALLPTPELPEVYRAICKIQKELSRDGIAKSMRNQQQGYSFRGIDDVMNAMSALLAGADLCILPRMAERTQEERQTAKGGTLFYVTVRADFDFVSSKDASKHTVTMYGEAMDSADKATNKAMSAAYKYAMLQTFCIPTEGMVDADATTHQPAPKKSKAAPKPAPKPELVPPPAPPQPVVEVMENREVEYEEIPMDEEEISEVEQQMAATLAMTEGFKGLFARYQAINMGHTYHQFLGLHGVRHAAGFNDIEAARNCYREMAADLKMREEKRARGTK